MKKIYSFLILILFINASLASDVEDYSDNEDYYDGMMDELYREGHKLLNSVYYNPTATYVPRTSHSLVLAVVGEPTEDNGDDKGILETQTTPCLARAVPDKTLFDLLNDEESEKALNFSAPYTLDERRTAALVHLSQFVKNNDIETILALTFFLDSVFNSSDPKSFDVEVFKSRFVECETPSNQKEFIETEKKRYEFLR